MTPAVVLALLLIVSTLDPEDFWSHRTGGGPMLHIRERTTCHPRLILPLHATARSL